MKTEKEITLESHAGFVAAKRRLQELQSDLSGAEAEQRTIERRISEARSRSGIEAEAEGLLTGASEPGVNQGDEQELGRVRHRLAVLSAAIRQQGEIVGNEQRKASLIVCDGLRDEYEKLVRNIALAMIGLGKAALSERHFRDDLEGAGIKWYLPVMGFGAIGDPRLYETKITMYLIAAIVLGCVSRSEVPQDWLDAPRGWGCYLDRAIKEREATQPAAATPVSQRPQSAAKADGRAHV